MRVQHSLPLSAQLINNAAAIVAGDCYAIAYGGAWLPGKSAAACVPRAGDRTGTSSFPPRPPQPRHAAQETALIMKGDLTAFSKAHDLNSFGKINVTSL